jgi:glyoxylase-like metal-dependent hydrolase (beta-lactamase superfamily II)
MVEEAVRLTVYHTLVLPTPFTVGTVNSYLIKDESVTLIDCGPYTYDAKECLTKQLNKHGLTLKDIKQILITHAHPDHAGLAAELQQISGAKVYIHTNEHEKTICRKSYREKTLAFLLHVGFPKKHIKSLVDFFAWEGSMASPLTEVLPIDNGDIINFTSSKLEVIFTPGHSRGHLSFLDRSKSLLFVGDTVLERITPNPVIEPLSDKLRAKSLITYLESLNRLKSLNPSNILPGHGAPICNPQRVLERITWHSDVRKMQINEIVRQRKEISLLEIVFVLWPNIKEANEIHLGMSEVLGHIDILELEDKIFLQQTSSGLVIRESKQSMRQVWQDMYENKDSSVQ